MAECAREKGEPKIEWIFGVRLIGFVKEKAKEELENFWSQIAQKAGSRGARTNIAIWCILGQFNRFSRYFSMP